jgi:hypothetical protein
MMMMIKLQGCIFELAQKSSQHPLHAATRRRTKTLKLRGGTVPVYVGATDIKEWLPHPSAVIHLLYYATPQLAALHIKQILSNETAYMEHQAWTEMPFQPGFHRILEEQFDSVFCRLCDWYDKEKRGG